MVVGIFVNNVVGIIVELRSNVVGETVIPEFVISGADEDRVDNVTVEVVAVWIILDSPSVKNDPLV